jgi:hypothetical protein
MSGKSRAPRALSGSEFRRMERESAASASNSRCETCARQYGHCQ